MRTLTDSSPMRADPRSLARRMASDGYLFFRRLLDPEAVRALREEILRTICDAGWLQPGTDPTRARPGSSARREGTDGWWDGYTAVQRLEAFHAFAFAPPLEAVLEAVIGEEVVAHPRKVARVIWPARPELTTRAHQDYVHNQGTPDCLTCWAPLGDCPPGSGGLRILTGSHTGGVRPMRPADGAGGVAIDVDPDHADWATAAYDAGDVLVFHSLTVHAALPNTSDTLRVSTDNRYQSVREPITDAALQPHLFPRVPGWDVLTEGWSTTRWIRTPAMDVVPIRFARRIEDWHHELEPGPSRFASVT